jgi:LysR family hydrogen peroxide-inducible transcriptional activator
MIPITLRHLRYFDALAQHGHFGRAADACAISQPALSLQMKELEDILGAPLIERGPRRIRLTALGEAFAARARDILRAVDELGDLARASFSPLTGRLRLGVIPTVAPYMLPAIIQTLTARFPGLDLRPREAVTQKLVDDLIEGRLDAAIVALPISEPSLHEQPLFPEAFMLVRPLADAGKPVPEPQTLREMRLLLLEEGHCFRDQALSFCGMDGGRAEGGRAEYGRPDAGRDGPRDLMEGSSLATLVQMVGAGIGVTLIPEMAVPIETRSARVSIAGFPRGGPARTIGMAWRRTNPLSQQLTHIAGLVREACRPGG